MQFVGAKGSGMPLLVKITSELEVGGEQAAQSGGATLPGVTQRTSSNLPCEEISKQAVRVWPGVLIVAIGLEQKIRSSCVCSAWALLRVESLIFSPNRRPLSLRAVGGEDVLKTHLYQCDKR